MDPASFHQYKSLLLGLPGWNDPARRRTFLRDAFWGEDWLNRLHEQYAGEEAADELVELLSGLERTASDGRTPACALLALIRTRFGADPQGRGPVLAELERALCRPSAPLGSVLFVAANPEHRDPDLDPIRTDLDYKRISNALAGAAGRPPLTLHPPVFAATIDDLARALHATRPGVLHFSGHGGGLEGLWFEDGPASPRAVSGAALAAQLRLFRDCVRVVVLNACYSEPQARAIAGYIDYVIGTREALGDDTAVAFSTGFYQALASGRTVADAFQAGCARIRLEGLPGHTVPVLLSGPDKALRCVHDDARRTL